MKRKPLYVVLVFAIIMLIVAITQVVNPSQPESQIPEGWTPQPTIPQYTSPHTPLLRSPYSFGYDDGYYELGFEPLSFYDEQDKEEYTEGYIEGYIDNRLEELEEIE